MAGEQAPQGIDPTIPSVARMYDYYLGGKDNFASDRAAAEKFIEIVPGVREMAQANRAFLRRAVSELAARGVRQFLDIGSGLPTQENVHQVVHRIIPDARVTYVDNDPIVLAHGRALLSDNPHTTVIQADMREPKALLDHPEVRASIDFDEPVAVILLAMLHFVPDDAVADQIIASVREVLSPGSHLVLSHAYAGRTGAETRARADDVYGSTTAGSITSRGPAELAAYLDGLDVLPPGVVPVEAWRPEFDEDVTVDFSRPSILGAVARVP
ncbi:MULTISPECIES: SAM-dependent methyltransferase [Streptosporangium]|uniref:SAM-dependent methyltransferase n=1 Tax=Streptosporangium brasiliense TaxID=47480 RepID=A0ABT9QVX5_9ACTN|nr:SAM-dependent methyltransferase [Streptosporangium brasiliense]MDP9861117.1 SAM-dependent methyltransferase [Streptosporangium brasiliense]